MKVGFFLLAILGFHPFQVKFNALKANSVEVSIDPMKKEVIVIETSMTRSNNLRPNAFLRTWNYCYVI